jgi:hypothetical protein
MAVSRRGSSGLPGRKRRDAKGAKDPSYMVVSQWGSSGLPGKKRRDAKGAKDPSYMAMPPNRTGTLRD